MPRTGVWNMSNSTARRLSLGAQGFADPPPKSTVDRRHLRRVMKRLRVIQLDSVPVIIRTQYLPFHSRLGPYDTTLFDDVAYRSGHWFEAWSHEASLLPVETEPLFRWAKQRAKDGQTWKGLADLAAKNPRYVEAVLQEVNERGAVLSKDLSDVPQNVSPINKAASTEKHAGWWNRSDAKNALDWLFRIGELGVRRVGNFEKQYVPFSSLIPTDVLVQPTPEPSDAIRELTRQSVQALGVGTVSDISDYFRLPVTAVRRSLDELVDGGDIVAAVVEGWDKPAFADPAARVPQKISATTVLSPFDPVVWNRDRAQRLFNFEYKLEIYTPKAKRRWGYYVLPILDGDRIVGRIDAKTHRAERRLEVIAMYLESGGGREAAASIRAAIADLANLVEAESVSYVEAHPVDD